MRCGSRTKGTIRPMGLNEDRERFFVLCFETGFRSLDVFLTAHGPRWRVIYENEYGERCSTRPKKTWSAALDAFIETLARLEPATSPPRAPSD